MYAGLFLRLASYPPALSWAAKLNVLNKKSIATDECMRLELPQQKTNAFRAFWREAVGTYDPLD